MRLWGAQDDTWCVVGAGRRSERVVGRRAVGPPVAAVGRARYTWALEAMGIWDGELVKEAVGYRWISKYLVLRVKWDRLGLDSSPTGMSHDDDSGPNILLDGEGPFISAIES